MAICLGTRSLLIRGGLPTGLLWLHPSAQLVDTPRSLPEFLCSLTVSPRARALPGQVTGLIHCKPPGLAQGQAQLLSQYLLSSRMSSAGRQFQLCLPIGGTWHVLEEGNDGETGSVCSGIRQGGSRLLGGLMNQSSTHDSL